MFVTRGARRLAWIAGSFLLISIATRVGLALFSGEHYTLFQWVRFMVVGFIFDITVLPWFILPWAVYEAVMPEFSEQHRLGRWESRWAAVWGTLFLVLFIITAVSEFTFWEEFGNRFDFIAVDYLVYTHEVIGNIRESYPVGWWIAIIVTICLAISWFSWPRGRNAPRTTRLARWGRAAVTGLAIVLGVAVVDQGLAETAPNAHVQQLSNNGIFSLFHAYRHNELDYDKYYPTIAEADLNSKIRTLVQEANTTFTGKNGIERKIAARLPEKNVNVILVTIESLSAEFVGRFGNTEGLTPELDKLAGQGLLFRKMYATGTRTVRGLEALTVGTPPTPGQSIVRRPESNGLVTLGGHLKDKGWTPYWIYGGYGFFDNMNDYYKGNRFTVVDRSDVDASGITIHHENIWGIADEDLYSLAMENFDREHEKGHRFFAQIMTTSNHRPYTFPENRIDLPQKKRESAIKYTDWAIGDFVRRAAKKPWFDNTLFIFISDHTSKAAGRTDLPPERYHIPMIWYAPKLVEPGVMDRLMSQIDVGPTLMGWLGQDYSSRFFGYDIFNLEPGRERAFISTYQKLGYMKDGRLVVLNVNKDPVVVAGLPALPGGPSPSPDKQLIDEAISWYQSASLYFRTGRLKDGAIK